MKEIDYKLEELIPIVAELAEQYGGYESTSITYERADQLMEAVIYCIREYEMSSGPFEEGNGKIVLKDKVTAKEAYRRGCQLADEKVRRMKAMYHGLLLDFRSYGNIALKEAVEAIPEFLKWYNIKYEPQDTILTLDYPVLADLGQYSGIDAVYEYIRCITIEQRFLSRFPDTYVRSVLCAYSEEYEEMFENLCGILLADVVRHILLKKPFDGTELTEEERDRMRAALEMYPTKEVKRIVRKVVKDFIKEFYENDLQMYYYVEKECDNIAIRELTALSGDQRCQGAV